MDIVELREHCISVAGATEGFPFTQFRANNILVFKIVGKMFAMVDIEPSDGIYYVWLKSDPDRAALLREQYRGIKPAWGSFGRRWNLVNIESDVPDEVIKELIAHSVAEVVKAMPKKLREEYNEGYP